MIIKYTTKRDINGNRKTLIVDHAGQTYRRDYNSEYNYNDYITITSRDRKKLIDILDSNGYKSIY